MKTTEYCIRETVNSLDGIQRAECDSLLYEKVLLRIHQQKTKRVYLKPGFLWKIAAMVTLLIGLNVYTLLQYNKTGKSNTITTASTIAEEYFSYIQTIKF